MQSQTLKFMGKEATLNAEYDRNARENFLSEATLSGAVDDVKYELTTGFGDDYELTLTTDTKAQTPGPDPRPQTQTPDPDPDPDPVPVPVPAPGSQRCSQPTSQQSSYCS